MPTRSHLSRPRPRNATIDLGDGDTLNITYNANALTGPWLDGGLLRDAEGDTQSLAKALAEVMLGWDLTEDDGTLIAPTAEEIATLSYPVQTGILDGILNAVVTRAEGEVSGHTSPTLSTDSPPPPSSDTAPHQNGHQTSPSPTPLASQSTS